MPENSQECIISFMHLNEVFNTRNVGRTYKGYYFVHLIFKPLLAEMTFPLSSNDKLFSVKVSLPFSGLRTKSVVNGNTAFAFLTINGRLSCQSTDKAKCPSNKLRNSLRGKNPPRLFGWAADIVKIIVNYSTWNFGKFTFKISHWILTMDIITSLSPSRSIYNQPVQVADLVSKLKTG